MVGRLVEQQDVRLADTHAGDERDALPPAAEGCKRPLAQRLGHFQLLQRHIGAPAFAFLLLGGEGAQHRLAEGELFEAGRKVLLHMPDGEAAGAGDLARRRLEGAGDAFQQRGLAAPVRGDEADAVAGGDGEAQIGKEVGGQRDAERTDIDERHGKSLVFRASRRGVSRQSRERPGSLMQAQGRIAG